MGDRPIGEAVVANATWTVDDASMRSVRAVSDDDEAEAAASELLLVRPTTTRSGDHQREAEAVGVNAAVRLSID